MNGPGQAPTRAAVLEYTNEQVVVREAYEFLDEKRLLLASELLSQLKRYQRLYRELDTLQSKAKDAMEAAVRHHGLDGLQVYPAASLDGAEFRHALRNFMGVTLLESELEMGDAKGGHAPSACPSGVAERCGQLFRQIVVKCAELAGVSGNLYRMLSEYRVTERRSRALENIILPEIEQALRKMTMHLDELDLEDAIRVRLQSPDRLQSFGTSK